MTIETEWRTNFFRARGEIKRPDDSLGVEVTPRFVVNSRGEAVVVTEVMDEALELLAERAGVPRQMRADLFNMIVGAADFRMWDMDRQVARILESFALNLKAMLIMSINDQLGRELEAGEWMELKRRIRLVSRGNFVVVRKS